MAQAAGWAAIPISISMRGVFAELQKELAVPMQKAAKQAGGDLEKTVVTSAEKAAKAVEKANYRQKKATEELEAAESKLRAEKDKQSAAAKTLEAAEAKLESVRGDSKSTTEQILKAEADVDKKRAALETSTQRLYKAEGQVESAMAESARAAESLEKRTQEAAEATDDYAGSTDKAADSASVFEGWQVKAAAGIAAVGAAAVAGAKQLVDLGGSFDDAYDTIRVGTGASGEAFEGLKESMKNVATESIGVGSDMGQIGSTLADLNTRLGLTGEPLEEMTAQFLQLENMGVDADINNVSQALNGFGIEAKDMPGALDELFQVSQATGLSVDELAQSAVKAGPALRGFGFDMADSAALVGQMDKAGLDADKTLQSMQRALAGFAAEGRDAPEALQETIGSIEGLIETGDEAAAMDLAAGIFGTRGAAQFVDAVKTGTLSAEDFMAATGATSDTIAELAEETADFPEMWDQFKNNAIVALEPVATELFNGLAPALEVAIEKIVKLSEWVQSDLIPAFQGFGEWVQKNRDWLEPLGVALGVMAGSITAVALATKGWAAATSLYATVQKIATGELKLFNLAMKTNVIGIVITAIAALVAGLVYFFTKTETGQRIWASFTESLGEAWDAIKGFFTGGWDAIKEFFGGFGEKVGEVREKFSGFTESVAGKWAGLKDGMATGWSSMKQGVFDAFSARMETFKSAFSVVTDAVRGAWTWLKDTMLAVWETIKTAVITAFNSYINAWKANFDLAISGATTAWTWLKDTMLAVWETIKTAVLWAFQTALDGWKQIFHTIVDAVVSKWTWLKDSMAAAWEWIRGTVFDGFRTGLENLRGWFETGVDAITKIWDGLKEAAAKPVRFVVDTVWNNGLLKAIGAVSKFIGLDAPEPIKIGFARGGILPGFSRMRDGDDQLVPMRRGEGVLVSEGLRDPLSRDLFLDANEQAKRGKSFSQYLTDFATGYSRGGIVESIVSAVNKNFPEMTITSTYRNTNDHHGAGKAVDFSNGTDSTPQMQRAAQWFFENYGGGLLELIHSPFSNNVKNGENVGDGFGFYGAGTMNAHRNHVHVAAPAPLGDPSVMVEQIAAGAGGGGFNLSAMVKGAWDKIVNAITPFKEEPRKWFSQIPGAFLKKASESVWDFVSGLVGKFSGAAGVSGDVESWREMAIAAMRRNGFDADDPAQVNAMLAQIQSESGGNPSVVQGVIDVNSGGNEAVGLLQVIPGTFAAHRDPELPNDRTDPWANMNAALRYYRATYGDDLTTMWGHGHGYAEGGIVDLPLFDNGGFWPKNTVAYNAIGTEAVFNPSQFAALMDYLGDTEDLKRTAKVLAEEGVPAWKAMGAHLSHIAETGDYLGNHVFAEDSPLTVAALAVYRANRWAQTEDGKKARKAGEDYLTEQAGGFLSIFGLEGLVPLGMKLGEKAWDAYQRDPVDVALAGGGVSVATRNSGHRATARGETVVIEYSGHESDREWRLLEKMQSEIDWLKAVRKPKAASGTRGGPV